jgi:glutamyl-tRNA synthetase
MSLLTGYFMTVVTRFAPSPTGFLHIGGARTALFNYLYAKNRGGKYLLRIEDTDAKRSTQPAIDAIISGLNWLGIKHDGDIVFQSKNVARHKQVAYELIARGSAYKCFCTPEELDEMRKAAEADGRNFKYPKIWRDKKESEAPAGAPFAIRIKAPLTGEIVISDQIRGEVKYPADDLDDMVLLRADGTPTYMLAVVVDDHDMNVTHIIRGEDHLTNSFRQKMIFDAMGWQMPITAHVPLIHGADGAKLSKRHGAQGVEEYRDMGYLPEAVNNYLMSLGWHYGDEETITMAEAIKRFDIAHVGKSPSRFDFTKLNHINGIYLRKKSADEIVSSALPFLKNKFGDKNFDVVKKLAPAIAERSQTLVEFANNCEFIFARLPYTEKAAKMLEQGKQYLPAVITILSGISDWNAETIKKNLDDYGTTNNLKHGMYMPPIRAGICGTMESPNLVDVMSALGKEEVLKRMNNL